jgi:HAE1 family hydrophobic/amphiphilic exporter-1/multidrug efflux pump
VDVDREKAKALGVSLDELYGTLAATLGSYYVNDFNKFGRTWQVLMSADPAYRDRPDDIGKIFVRSSSNEMVPLASLARVRYSAGPDSLDRFNNLPAVKIFGQAAPGVSSGQAIQRVEEIASEVLPADFSYDWGGASFQEKRSAGTSGLALGLAAVMVFLILAAQYEKWSLPLSVLLALPFGTFGALAAIWINNLVFTALGRAPLTNDVYFQIGLVTLLGLAAKNAILIVEYAVLKRDEGLSASAAAVEAARLRFRPILMTSLAFILGVVPLVLSSGAGAGARHSVGTGVMGGMMAATFLAIFFVPMFFKLMTDRHLAEKRSTADMSTSARPSSFRRPGRKAVPATLRTAAGGASTASRSWKGRWRRPSPATRTSPSPRRASTRRGRSCARPSRPSFPRSTRRASRRASRSRAAAPSPRRGRRASSAPTAAR